MKRMRSLLALGLTGLGVAALAACSHEALPLSLNPQYRLAYDDKGETVALAYGLPNSDDVALMLECAKGSARVDLSDTVRDKKATTVVLAAGGKKTSVAVQHQQGEEDEILAGKLPLSAPALQAFRQTGVLQVSSGQSRYTITAGPGARPGVERFFKVCG